MIIRHPKPSFISSLTRRWWTSEVIRIWIPIDSTRRHSNLASSTVVGWRVGFTRKVSEPSSYVLWDGRWIIVRNQTAHGRRNQVNRTTFWNWARNTSFVRSLLLYVISFSPSINTCTYYTVGKQSAFFHFVLPNTVRTIKSQLVAHIVA